MPKRATRSLSERYQQRIDKSGSFRTKVKRNQSGKRVGGGTLVNQSTVDAIRGDEEVCIIVANNNAMLIETLLSNAIGAALEEVGLVAEGAAKRLCPVDTGRLRNSITHALLAERTVIIGTNVEYAPYVHEGTSKREGNPFLVDAAQRNYNRFKAIFEKHLRK